MWCAPERTRAQFQVGLDLIDVVFLGSTWWSVGHGMATTNAGHGRHGHGMGCGEALIRPRRYIPFLDLQEVAEDSWHGRKAFLARAIPVWGDEVRQQFESRRVMHRLLIGDPDELLLTVDAQRGVLLRTEARLAGTSYRIVEMDEVSFDEEFGPEVFAIHPPEGQDWKGPGRPGAER